MKLVCAAAEPPVVAFQDTTGWYAVMHREGPGAPLEAVPVEYATLHADGSRTLWREELDGSVLPLSPRAVVRSTVDAAYVPWSAHEMVVVPEESTASWRPEN